MDSMLYNILKSLILPPGGLILLLLVGSFLVPSVLGRVLIFVGIVMLTLMSLPTVARNLMVGLEPYAALRSEALADAGADGILILGAERYSWAPEYGGDTVGPHSLERLRYGAFLHRRTGLPIYITGGGPATEHPPVGRMMAQVLADEYGITATGVEDRSLTTEQNAALSAPMLDRDGIGRVFLVTHASHLPRAVAAFERVGIEVTPAPTCFAHHGDTAGPDYRDWLPAARAFLMSYYALHEYLGQLWYRLEAILGRISSAMKEA